MSKLLEFISQKCAKVAIFSVILLYSLLATLIVKEKAGTLPQVSWLEIAFWIDLVILLIVAPPVGIVILYDFYHLLAKAQMGWVERVLWLLGLWIVGVFVIGPYWRRYQQPEESFEPTFGPAPVTKAEAFAVLSQSEPRSSAPPPAPRPSMPVPPPVAPQQPPPPVPVPIGAPITLVAPRPTPQAEAQTAPDQQIVDCPLCAKPILYDSLVSGDNTCPHCSQVFDA